MCHTLKAQNGLAVAMHYLACQRTYHDNVGVFVSHIRSLGLYCLQEIKASDMVIEYAGTVIRFMLTNYLKKYYHCKN